MTALHLSTTVSFYEANTLDSMLYVFLGGTLCICCTDVWYTSLWVHKRYVLIESRRGWFKIYVRKWMWHYHGQALSADIYLSLMILATSPRAILEGSERKRTSLTGFLCLWNLGEEFHTSLNASSSRPKCLDKYWHQGPSESLYWQ